QSSDELTVTVLPANTAPVVSAGANQTITLPATATLQGTAADDGVPLPLTYAWTGPAGVTFSNASALATTASFAAAGTYVLRLTASDGQLSASAEVTITLQPANTKPVVDAGPDRSVNVGETATLDGKVTDDSSSLSIQWTVLSGPSQPSFGDPSSASTTVLFS